LRDKWTRLINKGENGSNGEANDEASNDEKSEVENNL
jgi:hypothetical protein